MRESMSCEPPRVVHALLQCEIFGNLIQKFSLWEKHIKLCVMCEPVC